MALTIPNAEIRGIYQDTILKWFEDSGNEIICYGIAFYKKECLIQKKE